MADETPDFAAMTSEELHALYEQGKPYSDARTKIGKALQTEMQARMDAVEPLDLGQMDDLGVADESAPKVVLSPKPTLSVKEQELVDQMLIQAGASSDNSLSFGKLWGSIRIALIVRRRIAQFWLGGAEFDAEVAYPQYPKNRDSYDGAIDPRKDEKGRQIQAVPQPERIVAERRPEPVPVGAVPDFDPDRPSADAIKALRGPRGAPAGLKTKDS